MPVEFFPLVVHPQGCDLNGVPSTLDDCTIVARLRAAMLWYAQNFDIRTRISDYHVPGRTGFIEENFWDSTEFLKIPAIPEAASMVTAPLDANLIPQLASRLGQPYMELNPPESWGEVYTPPLATTDQEYRDYWGQFHLDEAELERLILWHRRLPFNVVAHIQRTSDWSSFVGRTQGGPTRGRALVLGGILAPVFLQDGTLDVLLRRLAVWPGWCSGWLDWLEMQMRVVSSPLRRLHALYKLYIPDHTHAGAWGITLRALADYFTLRERPEYNLQGIEELLRLILRRMLGNILVTHPSHIFQNNTYNSTAATLRQRMLWCMLVPGSLLVLQASNLDKAKVLTCWIDQLMELLNPHTVTSQDLEEVLWKNFERRQLVLFDEKVRQAAPEEESVAKSYSVGLGGITAESYGMAFGESTPMSNTATTIGITPDRPTALSAAVAQQPYQAPKATCLEEPRMTTHIKSTDPTAKMEAAKMEEPVKRVLNNVFGTSPEEVDKQTGVLLEHALRDAADHPYGFAAIRAAYLHGLEAEKKEESATRWSTAAEIIQQEIKDAAAMTAARATIKMAVATGLALALRQKLIDRKQHNALLALAEKDVAVGAIATLVGVLLSSPALIAGGVSLKEHDKELAGVAASAYRKLGFLMLGVSASDLLLNPLTGLVETFIAPIKAVANVSQLGQGPAAAPVDVKLTEEQRVKKLCYRRGYG